MEKAGSFAFETVLLLSDFLRKTHFFLNFSQCLIGKILRLLGIALDYAVNIIFVFREIGKTLLKRLLPFWKTRKVFLSGFCV